MKLLISYDLEVVRGPKTDLAPSNFFLPRALISRLSLSDGNVLRTARATHYLQNIRPSI